ncbi:MULTISPECIES: LysR substrate-binding domain-containing protein [Gammaproteobacteria]|uniref:LysR family transcriptional regulator n=1 Tax=Rhodanobacter lindaniclasticus TaxID=75310 RepID=A0A4S3KEE4_9GAMM|nr:MULTISPECIES: LysR substrate-binding domain-containing protein [Gammaproteobacteria]MBN4939242.1 LysR family transcriptional regulator [Stenotrophomonas maltophilia]HAT3706665.1 LysR family transcriptional regulator [Citrobacter freundii]EKY4184651.1 LysR family transcriptional regulator [Pseudomonas aeruginosa]ELH7236014.1 LysR family transcriptional regulator [Pseudomonas aeruginosa]ELT0909244.1 LysR family transcriptional regulator [Pseudomonas aeruginosa]
MESSDITAEIRMAVLGEWVPPQLADVLALQRAEEPETHAVLAGWTDPGRGAELPDDGFDFALSAVARQWPGWVCEPLWHDTLAVAVAKRSHLLAYREVPCQEVLKQPLICAQSTTDEPWRMTVQRVFENALQEREQTVETFDVAMTLVAAGYGIAIAPAARLASYLRRGIAVRPLAGAPTIVMAYLLRRDASLSDTQARFARRARLVS